MKVTVQEKIAELERRIRDLEQRQRTDAVATKTVTRIDLQPELGQVWKSFDDLLKKVFNKAR